MSVPWVKADSLKTKNLCYIKEPIRRYDVPVSLSQITVHCEHVAMLVNHCNITEHYMILSISLVDTVWNNVMNVCGWLSITLIFPRYVSCTHKIALCPTLWCVPVHDLYVIVPNSKQQQ